MITSFNVKKTEQIYYLVNKEKHKQQLRDIKPATDTGIKTQKSQLNLKRDKNVMNYGQRYEIDVGNSRLVNRILSIARPNKLSKIKHEPTRLSIQKRNIVKNQQLQRQNTALQHRLRKAKPAIGSMDVWKKDYERSILGRRRSRQFQFDEEMSDSIRKNTIMNPILYRQTPINTRSKETGEHILSLPRMQLRQRYKTELQCIESTPGTMR